MKTVLITGVAGFIGMHTAIKLIDQGITVLGIDNINDYYSVALKRKRIEKIKIASTESAPFIFFKEDLNSINWDVVAKWNIDAVIHLAAQAGVRYSLENPEAYVESNILGFQQVLNFVSQNTITSFLYASSSSVYGKTSYQPFSENENCSFPESYYAATKKCNELMAYAYWKTKNISSIGLRFFTVYGPWGRPDMAPMIFTKAALNHKTIKVFNYGEQKRDFTYIDDIVDGIMLLLAKSFKYKGADIFNIGNGSPTSLLDFIKIIERETGVVLQKEYAEAQKGDVEITFADITKLKEEVGYNPSIKIDVGLNRTVSWYKEYEYLLK